MKIYRALSMLLLTAMLVSLAACSNDTANGGDTTDSVAADEVTEKLFLDDLEPADFNDAEFNILVRESRLNTLYSKEASGDVLSQALYKRDEKIEERFNVSIEYITALDRPGDWNSFIDQDVMANIGAYDAVMPDYWYGCETRYQFINLKEYDNIFDFDAPWWYQGWNDNAEIDGQLYTAVGSMNLDTIRNTIAIYVNSELAEELDLPDMFELVYNGEWTIDKYYEFANLAVNDTSGNGTIDMMEGDRIGAYLGAQQSREMWTAYGIEYTTKNEDGEWTFDNFMTERTVDVFSKVRQLYNSEAFFFGANPNEEDYTINTESAFAQNLFMNNNILFFGGQLKSTEQFRDMKGDFTIIPFPKFNEEQEDYVSGNFGVCYLALPVSVKNPEMSATILEAMNAESYKSVVPAYYETSLKTKYTRDDGQTAEMLDFITERVRFDFAMTNTASIQNKPWAAFDLTGDNVVSNWESIKGAAALELEELLETYREMSE